MDVKLIAHTPDPERVVATAARLCYSKCDGQELLEEMSDKEIDHLLSIIRKNGHTSTFEHASFTFSISGISRVTTHQLVRHRVASYSQQSQRYVTFDELGVISPDSITNKPKALDVYSAAVASAKNAYNQLIEMGVPIEDARYVLPNASASNIIVTMNARELLKFFELRCCNRAQWEIRDLAWRMLVEARNVAPKLFLTAGPGCIKGECPEGTMTCGMPYSGGVF